MSDAVIGSTLQTVASHFPSAQNNLTVYFIFVLTLGFSGILMKALYGVAVAVLVLLVPLVFVRWMLEEVLKANPDMENWQSTRLLVSTIGEFKLRKGIVLAVDSFVVLLCGSYAAEMPRLLDRPSWVKDELGRPMSLNEKILFKSVFYSNIVNSPTGGSPARLICSNLPANVSVSMVNPSDIVPGDTLVAEVREGEGGVATAYRYKLERCENTNDPSRIRDTKPS